MTRVSTSDNLTLAVHDLGGSGRPVLAAHATGFHGRVWQPVAGHLGNAHVIAPDFRGHGDSVVPRDYSFDWERFADDVLDTLSAVGWLDTADLPIGIGHSMGGAALFMAELRRPGTFAALWIYEPITFPRELRQYSSEANQPLPAGARRRRRQFDSFDDAIASYASKPPMDRFTPEALAAYVHGGFSPTDDGKVTLKCRPEDEAQVYETAGTCDAFERLGELTCPTIVVRGRVEPFSPASLTPQIASGLADGHLEIHDDLDHFGPMVDPTAMAASVQNLAERTAPDQ